jgi:hypothetical protein
MKMRDVKEQPKTSFIQQNNLETDAEGLEKIVSQACPALIS